MWRRKIFAGPPTIKLKETLRLDLLKYSICEIKSLKRFIAMQKS